MNATDKRLAIVVNPSLAIGLIANTVATIAVGLGAAEPIFGNVTLTDRAGRSMKNSADRPVPILQASAEALRTILLGAFGRSSPFAILQTRRSRGSVLPAPSDG